MTGSQKAKLKKNMGRQMLLLVWFFLSRHGHYFSTVLPKAPRVLSLYSLLSSALILGDAYVFCSYTMWFVTVMKCSRRNSPWESHIQGSDWDRTIQNGVSRTLGTNKGCIDKLTSHWHAQQLITGDDTDLYPNLHSIKYRSANTQVLCLLLSSNKIQK